VVTGETRNGCKVLALQVRRPPVAQIRATIRVMTAVLVAKALLLAFLIVACGVLVVTYVRRRRAGVRPWQNPYAAPYLDVYRGALPRVPPPPEMTYERSADGEPAGRGPDSVAGQPQ
jgi:hypothetical protein